MATKGRLEASSLAEKKTIKKVYPVDTDRKKRDERKEN
jgi:hypothetical protein